MSLYRNILLLAVTAVLSAGCFFTKDKTEDDDFIVPQAEIEAVLKKGRPPQQFGYNIYRTGGGNTIGYTGSLRLHPNHMATVDFKEDGIPLIEVRGRSKKDEMNMLIDFSSPHSWMEYATARDFDFIYFFINNMSIPYQGIHNTGGVPAFAGICTQLRIEDLFMEDVPFYTRMAEGTLGPLARGVVSPLVEAVMGYDSLHHFEYIRIDPDKNKIQFSTTIPFVPHENLVMTKAKIVLKKNYGLVVEGGIDGVDSPIVLDYAGDYSFARGDKRTQITRQVSIGDIVYRKVPTMLLPNNDFLPRAGRRLLDRYMITICPKEGVVYFEQYPDTLEKKKIKDIDGDGVEDYQEEMNMLP